MKLRERGNKARGTTVWNEETSLHSAEGPLKRSCDAASTGQRWVAGTAGRVRAGGFAKRADLSEPFARDGQHSRPRCQSPRNIP
jgi:hypothetical protein